MYKKYYYVNLYRFEPVLDESDARNRHQIDLSIVKDQESTFFNLDSMRQTESMIKEMGDEPTFINETVVKSEQPGMEDLNDTLQSEKRRKEELKDTFESEEGSKVFV